MTRVIKQKDQQVHQNTNFRFLLRFFFLYDAILEIQKKKNLESQLKTLSSSSEGTS